MSGVAFTLNWDAATMEAVTGAFRALAEFDGARSHAMWDAIGGKLDTGAVLRFEAQQDPQGNPWVPSHRAIKEDGRTLHWHGYLEGSITHNVIGDDGVESGSPMIYAGTMQDGAKFTVPPRSQQIYRHTGRDEDTTFVTEVVDAKGNVRKVRVGRQFVKKSRSNFASWVTIGGEEGYEVTIPARPFLGISAGDSEEVLDTALTHLDKAWKGRAP